MIERILLGCKKCLKNVSIELEDAKKYHKDNPFVCDTCSKQPVIPLSRDAEQRNQEDQNEIKSVSVNEWITPQKPIYPTPHFITYNDPNVNEEIVRTQNAGVFHSNTIEDFEQRAKDEIKTKLDEFKSRREQLDREYQAEQVRVDSYRDGGGLGFFSIIPIIIGIAVMVLITTQIFGAVSSAVNEVDCTKLTDNETAKACQSAKTNTTNTSTIMFLMLPILIIFPLIFIIRGILL